MNKGILTVGVIMLALAALLLINVISNYSTGSEFDYYLLKDTTEAAMVDAIDERDIRTNGQIRLDTEKFVENFLVRFANSVDNAREYVVTFYDINEVPPKVSVKVESKTVLAAEGSQVDINTTYDGIIEANTEDLSSEEIRALITEIKNGNLSGSYVSENGKFKQVD